MYIFKLMSTKQGTPAQFLIHFVAVLSLRKPKRKEHPHYSRPQNEEGDAVTGWEGGENRLPRHPLAPELVATGQPHGERHGWMPRPEPLREDDSRGPGESSKGDLVYIIIFPQRTEEVSKRH